MTDAPAFDLAAEAGGNCAQTVPGEVITTDNGVTVVGSSNLPGMVAADASNQAKFQDVLTFLKDQVSKG